MDSDLSDQQWTLTPMSHFNRNVSTVTTWDHQHNMVYKKNLKKLDENEDVYLNKDQKKAIFQNKERTLPIILQNTDIDPDFQLYLENFQMIQSYETIFKDNLKLEFSGRKNHIFF